MPARGWPRQDTEDGRFPTDSVRPGRRRSVPGGEPVGVETERYAMGEIHDCNRAVVDTPWLEHVGLRVDGCPVLLDEAVPSLIGHTTGEPCYAGHDVSPLRAAVAVSPTGTLDGPPGQHRSPGRRQTLGSADRRRHGGAGSYTPMEYCTAARASTCGTILSTRSSWCTSWSRYSS